MKGWFAVAALLLAPASAASISVVDDVGRTVTVEAPAQRIVSLAPHLTEVLFDLGVGENIVATVRFSDFPDEAKSIPRLGDAFAVNVEALVASAPDIVFAWRSGGTLPYVERLIGLGLPVYINEAPRLEDIPRSVAAMSELVGRGEVGRALASSFTDRIRAVGTEARDISVFFQIADAQLFTINNDHLIGQSILTCGARNAFAESKVAVPMISQEAVIAANPDLIVITQRQGSSSSPWVEKWLSFPGLNAQVASIDPDLISRPGLRMADGIEALCAIIDDASQAPKSTPGLR